MTDSSFPKDHRLLKPKDFKWVFDQPLVKVHGTHLMLFARINLEISHARLGLAITKKKVPTAVARNRLKRISREQFRLAVNLPNVDMVLIAKKPISELTKAQLHQEVQEILRNLAHKIKKSADKT